MSKNICLLMTATITPPLGIKNLERKDPLIRERDYADALKFYLSISNDVINSIVFVENSLSDLVNIESVSDKFNLHKKNIEFISVNANDHPYTYGKGYGEFRMLDLAFDKSKFISAENPVCKVTGRLRIENIEPLIKTAPGLFDIYCDLRNVPLNGDSLGWNKWMDLRSFFITRDFYYRFLYGTYRTLREDVTGKSPENVLFDRLLRLRDSARIIPRFRMQPKLAGFGGCKNYNYENGKIKKSSVQSHDKYVLPCGSDRFIMDSCRAAKLRTC